MELVRAVFVRPLNGLLPNKSSYLQRQPLATARGKGNKGMRMRMEPTLGCPVTRNLQGLNILALSIPRELDPLATCP